MLEYSPSVQQPNKGEDSARHNNIQYIFDTVIVFGQGPIKPILLPSELTLAQHKQWIAYNQDIVHNWEPDFYMIQQSKQMAILEQIDKRTDINERTKEYLKITRRSEWQRTGWYALKKWGRQNALAAGFALYKGMTKEVILSGGRTIPKWVTEVVHPAILEDWPSEAELMQDIIVRQYAELYERKYHKNIEEAIKIEDASTNTIENFSYSINKVPALTMAGARVGFITANYHLKRVKLLARLFSIQGALIEQYSAQEILKQQIHAKEVEIEVEAEADVREIDKNPQIDMIMKVEKRWMEGLTNPEYITYWLGYLGDVNQPTVIQNALNLLKQPDWRKAAEKAFLQLGLRFVDYLNEDLSTLAKSNPDKYKNLIRGLKRLKAPEFRHTPPEL